MAKTDVKEDYVDLTTEQFYERILRNYQFPSPARVTFPYPKQDQLVDAILKLVNRL